MHACAHATAQFSHTLTHMSSTLIFGLNSVHLAILSKQLTLDSQSSLPCLSTNVFVLAVLNDRSKFRLTNVEIQ